MKKINLIAPALFLGLTAFGQFGQPTGINEINYEVYGSYRRAVKKEVLSEAKVIGDAIPGYPINWVTNYTSVEIVTTCNGKISKAIAANDILSNDQKNILSEVDLGADIVIDVKYKYKNPVTGQIENNTIQTTVTATPYIEAEYVGGKLQLQNYFKDNGITKVGGKDPLKPIILLAKFTVTEDGEIINTKITKTSGDKGNDKKILEAINKMPNWNPAKNGKGLKVKQDFELSINRFSGC